MTATPISIVLISVGLPVAFHVPVPATQARFQQFRSTVPKFPRTRS